MRRAKAGSERTLYFDSYAIYAIVRGDTSYQQYQKGCRVITTIMNLYETYHGLKRDGFVHEANFFLRNF